MEYNGSYLENYKDLLESVKFLFPIICGTFISFFASATLQIKDLGMSIDDYIMTIEILSKKNKKRLKFILKYLIPSFFGLNLILIIIYFFVFQNIFNYFFSDIGLIFLLKSIILLDFLVLFCAIIYLIFNFAFYEYQSTNENNNKKLFY